VYFEELTGLHRTPAQREWIQLCALTGVMPGLKETHAQRTFGNLAIRRGVTDGWSLQPNCCDFRQNVHGLLVQFHCMSCFVIRRGGRACLPNPFIHAQELVWRENGWVKQGGELPNP